MIVGGCQTIVIPPSHPVDPVHVVLVDYGRHTALALPRGEDVMVEYAYGDWKWYALGENEWHNVFATLLLPTQGALGRRTISLRPGHRPAEWVAPVRPMGFEVGAAEARALLDHLDERFETHAETEVYNAKYELTFVHDDDDFHIFNTCNDAVAGWLHRLRCTVRGLRLLGGFEVQEAEWWSSLGS